MKMLSRAALLLSAACLCTPVMAQPARLVTPNPAVVGLPGPFPFTGDEWVNFRQNREGVTAPITTVLAQEGVRQIGTTVTAAALTIPNDPSQFYLMNSATAQVVTIPSGLTKWAVGNTLTLVQLGAGQVQLVAGSGVTIVKRSSTLNSAGQYSAISLVNIGPDTWLVAGGLS